MVVHRDTLAAGPVTPFWQQTYISLSPTADTVLVGLEDRMQPEGSSFVMQVFDAATQALLGASETTVCVHGVLRPILKAPVTLTAGQTYYVGLSDNGAGNSYKAVSTEESWPGFNAGPRRFAQNSGLGFPPFNDYGLNHVAFDLLTQGAGEGHAKNVFGPVDTADLPGSLLGLPALVADLQRLVPRVDGLNTLTADHDRQLRAMVLPSRAVLFPAGEEVDAFTSRLTVGPDITQASVTDIVDTDGNRWTPAPNGALNFNFFTIVDGVLTIQHYLNRAPTFPIQVNVAQTIPQAIAALTARLNQLQTSE